MATTCVFVTVCVGAKVLVRTVDVEVSPELTFDELLANALELRGVVLESFEQRIVTVSMRATLASAFVEISKRTVTVISRIGAGQFITFNVAPPPPKPMARPEVAKADQAAARARSSYLLQAAGRALIARPEKHDVNNKLLSASLWFNGLVDSFEASGLAFAKADVCKPDGSGYRFVLALSQLLNHLDGHHLKLEKTNCALPDAEIFRSTFRKAGPGSTNSLPALSTDRIKSWVHDISCAMRMGGWSKDPSWRSMVVVVDLALAALRRHCGKREETCTKVTERHESLIVARDATTAAARPTRTPKPVTF
mmetsp:Transcript_14298/g.49498  ORF Transcript_14298/g.49498 Transcript_14298/m.49498 type:complete len:309 (-) Transcript_14298:598-1524(-)